MLQYLIRTLEGAISSNFLFLKVNLEPQAVNHFFFFFFLQSGFFSPSIGITFFLFKQREKKIIPKKLGMIYKLRNVLNFSIKV